MIGISFENEIRDYIGLLHVDETGCMGADNLLQYRALGRYY